MTKLWKIRVFKLSAGALALGAIGLVTPRAAHALAATLVQVTNTVANPAITQATNTAASQLVLLSGSAALPIQPTGTFNPLYQITSAGPAFSPYVVPAGQTLVVTEMDATVAQPGSGSIFLSLPPSNIDVAFLLVPQIGTQQLKFSSGIPFPAGSQVGVGNASLLSNAVAAYVYVHGYLTTN